MSALSQTASNPSTVYYDGECPLCRAEIALYRRHDGAGAIDLVDVRRSPARLPEGLGREAALGRFHVRAADGEILSGAAAFAELWSRLPGWHLLARFARLPGIRGLMELAYRGFLFARPLIVKIFVLLSRERRR
ncbi:MAG: DUF393 domain-containing protein [Maritimibacter sp.]|nr:DUF393 domain-containing protein [Maritimibacter sp.]